MYKVKIESNFYACYTKIEDRENPPKKKNGFIHARLMKIFMHVVGGKTKPFCVIALPFHKKITDNAYYFLIKQNKILQF